MDLSDLLVYKVYGSLQCLYCQIESYHSIQSHISPDGKLWASNLTPYEAKGAKFSRYYYFSLFFSNIFVRFSSDGDRDYSQRSGEFVIRHFYGIYG